RRHFEFLRCDRRSLVGEQLYSLEARAVADGRHRRFFDAHEDVSPTLVAVRELGDTYPAEQPERRQATLAFIDLFEPERLAGLELQLALDRRGPGPLIADDEHVVDRDALPFPYGKQHVGAPAVGAEAGTGDHGRRLKSAIGEPELHAIAVGSQRGGRKRPTRLQREPLAQLRLRNRHIAL